MHSYRSDMSPEMFWWESSSQRAIAEGFWRASGEAKAFPRDIERAVAFVLPVTVVKLPQLSMPEIASWLERRGLRVRVPSDHRELMGGVVAYRGHALVFVSGTDPGEEQRLTVAHEIAHVVTHYLRPRAAILNALGLDAAAVLDGDRQATNAERAAAVLARVRLGAHVHLLPRATMRDGRVGRAEAQADKLALELIAPADEVARQLRRPNLRGLAPDDKCAALGAYFGVPAGCFAEVVDSRTRDTPESFVRTAAKVIRAR